MPWKIIKNTYKDYEIGKGYYHIRFNGPWLTFNVICKYLNDGYKWFLYCESPSAQSILLGKAKDLSD